MCLMPTSPSREGPAPVNYLEMSTVSRPKFIRSFRLPVVFLACLETYYFRWLDQTLPFQNAINGALRYIQARGQALAG